MKLLISYGTRPEWIKIAPLVREFDKRGLEYKLLFTGQQIDIGEFKFDWRIGIRDGANRLDSIIASSMNFLPKILALNEITHVLVMGDTASAFGVGLSAFNNGLKVIHLEAGLRTYDKDNPYPEESYRRMISQIADIHLCPTKNNFKNLVNEQIYGDSYIVGNTVLDNLLPYKDKCEYTNKVLVTMHRRENHELLNRWFEEINALAKFHSELEFILPLHPNPNVQKHKHLLTHVNVVDPMSHEELLETLVKTKMVITDSGGIQEECSFFNKICLVCRKVTERPEALGQSSYTVKEPQELKKRFDLFLPKHEINYECPFGDGHSAEKITDILENLKD